jgi:hypothetical protein
VDYSEVLEKYLYRIARGDLHDTTSVLPLLVKTNVYFLGKDISTDSGEIDQARFSLPVRKKNDKNYVPVFLNRNRNNQPQPGGDSHFVEIPGYSLLQSLPGGFGLIIEPMTSLEVTFSSDVINDFCKDVINSEGDNTFHVESSSDANVNSQNKERNTNEVTQIDNSKIRYLHPNDLNFQAKDINTSLKEDSFNFGDDIRFNLFNETVNITKDLEIDDVERVRIGPSGRARQSNLENTDKKNSGKESSGSDQIIMPDVENRLLKVIDTFSSIEEAYSIHHTSSHSELVLGVLANPWGSDERFNFVEQVAKVAKDMYGYAGAIEVYDDLYDTHSKSWDLFKMISPFYSKDIDLKASSLSRKIEFDEVLNKPVSIKDSMSRLTKSGFKFFGKS